MTSPEYAFLGTLLTRESFESVTRNRSPPLQARSVSMQKSAREASVTKKLLAATRGPFREQFSEERLSDALAMCDRNWDHFRHSDGKLQPYQRWLPQQLGEQIREDRRRLQDEQSQRSLQQEPSRGARSSAAALLDDVVDRVPAAQQKRHTGHSVFGFAAGVPVKRAVERGLTVEQFKKRPVTPGSFVVTRPAPSGPWTKSQPQIAKLDYWMWHVLRVILPGETVPGFKKPAASHVYEARLFQPKKATKGKWVPLFEDDRTSFTRTPEEKARRKRRRFWGTAKTRALHDDDDEAGGDFLKPVCCFLRPENIIGGGFGRTGLGAVPEVVQRYALTQLAGC